MFFNHIRPLIILPAVALLMFQCTKGDGDEEKDEKPDANYTGTLAKGLWIFP